MKAIYKWKIRNKIGRFWFSNIVRILEFEGEKKITICGAPNYIAPEILDIKCSHSNEVDVWSLGIIM